MDFNVHPKMITSVLSYFEPISLQRLQEIIRETMKTFCFLDPTNEIKIKVIYVFVAPSIKMIINILTKTPLFYEKSDLLSNLLSIGRVLTEATWQIIAWFLTWPFYLM